jgi:hypothetical protein
MSPFPPASYRHPGPEPVSMPHLADPALTRRLSVDKVFFPFPGKHLAPSKLCGQLHRSMCTSGAQTMFSIGTLARTLMSAQCGEVRTDVPRAARFACGVDFSCLP